jgi:hypothetical protein
MEYRLRICALVPFRTIENRTFVLPDYPHTGSLHHGRIEAELVIGDQEYVKVRYKEPSAVVQDVGDTFRI